MKEKELFEYAKNIYCNIKGIGLKQIRDMYNINISEYRLRKYLIDCGVYEVRGYNPKLKEYLIGMERYKKGESINQICKDLNIDRMRFSRYMKKCGIETRKLPHKLDANFGLFDVIDTEDKAYWLGFLYADGNIRKDRPCLELSLGEKDKDHLIKFKNFMESKHSISRKESKLGNSFRISICDERLKNGLVKNGCFPDKSLSLKFPTEEQVPKHLIYHFIRGYFDGDGCLCITEKSLSCELIGTEDFLNSLKELYPQFRFKKIFRLGSKANPKNNYKIVFQAKKYIEIFLKSIYSDANIYLDRKFEKYNQFLYKYCRHK